ncbi:alpha-amylase family glycosyl hydrolase [Tahibacter caeni]|uniref:alpha-amylase family glycosyl hydrolase n=1 Tax=Tahibacter caeni TaxID=1453545 RepID=UPI00214734C4|nr:alpha-amylase family glycosyl hydrolase [Tahibacter caeni]
MNMPHRRLPVLLLAASVAACTHAPAREPRAPADELYGTLEPFASEAIYFAMTDRFVNGDPSNDQRDQGKAKGAAFFTFDRPTPGAPAGESDNVGYLGGDFKGIVDNAGYIRDMGFSAVWVTPVVDNPDEAFTGGDAVKWGGMFTDRGKTGYHGYWGVNFYRLDEHLPSAGLDFAGFTAALKRHGLKTVLDIVGNHGSPAFSMPQRQPQFGQVFDADGKLIADHQNLLPAELDPAHEPLHAFYNRSGNLAQLSDFDENNPAVLDYLSGAYLQWIAQGADAFRVDTIGWMPDTFWKAFVARIRAAHPGFFLFGEDFEYDAAKIAHHTWPGGGAVSVLDFPLRQRVADVFGTRQAGFETIPPALYLENGPYANPYDLVTFYDNHDMARLDATDAGFIDAHNWLFTARGIPAVYYGSEIGFMRGRAEHAGNRNYFGQDNVEAAKSHPIRAHLARIARVRAASPALQRGLQVNLEFSGARAAFLRVYQHAGTAQTALVLLNKGDAPATFALKDSLQAGTWRNALDAAAAPLAVTHGAEPALTVPAHDVAVWLLDAPLTDAALRQRALALMRASRTNGG